jgi:hypothetical protein
VAISGDSLLSLKEALVTHGFNETSIFTAALICTKIAKDSLKAPNAYWCLLDNSDFYLPWGKGY